MFIIIRDWKSKVLGFITRLALLDAFIYSAAVLARQLSQQRPALSNWFNEENPSGNPLRVENNDATGQKFDQIIDEMVIKMQDFYKEDNKKNP